MNIYLAGASAEADMCASYMARLREAGRHITLDWPANIRAVGDANPRDASHQDRLRWTMDDIRGVHDAEIFWLLVPTAHSIGCWAEFAIAWQGRQHLIVSGDWRRTIFTSLADERYGTHEEAFAALTEGRR